ncbi:hypothetical protein [Akkermansia sp.]|uniref:hypothetical protein n=1 Tax=Akkermansia sp. TaxID=1872421 RepID=UPI00399608D2
MTNKAISHFFSSEFLQGVEGYGIQLLNLGFVFNFRDGFHYLASAGKQHGISAVLSL